VAEVARKNTGKNLLEARFCFFASKLAGEFFECGLGAPSKQSQRANFDPVERRGGDHFQPQYRMPFASTEGFKDGLFLGEFTTLPAVDSPANFLIGRNPGVVEFKRVTKVRILLAPPRSLDRREIPLALRRNTRISQYFAIIRR